MAVSLQKRTAAVYVGSTWFTGTTHKLVPGWSYSTGTHTVCGIKWIGTLHTQNGAQFNITCKRCLAWIAKQGA